MKSRPLKESLVAPLNCSKNVYIYIQMVSSLSNDTPMIPSKCVGKFQDLAK